MALDEHAYSYLKRQIGTLLDIEIDAYKTRQMRRRLETFVAAHAGDSTMSFLRSLSTDQEVLGELRDMLTINVSEFFRDTSQFEILEHNVLPDQLRGRMQFNVWSAGCSYGHEPYSLAMMLEEKGTVHRARIVATDFDRQMLSRAQAGGPYPESEMRNVSPERLERFFVKADRGFKIKKSLRSRVHFSELNLLKDEFQTAFNLILCRNVMIYFSAEVKLALLRRFWDSLVPGGVLFVGATEALLGSEAEGFHRIGGNFYGKPKDATPASRPKAA